MSVDALDLSNEDVLKALIAEVRNTTIVSVYYGIANYQHRPYHYEGFHLCDFGVFFKLSNGGWLNWVWVEEKEDGDYGIEISQINLIGRLSVEANFIEVSDSVEWRALLRKRITKVEFEISEFGVYEHINRMKLEFEDKTVVSICSIEEPDPYRLPSLDSLRFGKDWTIVIFDELVLQKLVF